MTNEELLKTRYIIIADWPQSNINPFHVGDILVELSIYFTREKNPKSIHREEIVKYPHLFKKLEWWQEHRVEELPLYIKRVSTGRILIADWQWWETRKSYVPFKWFRDAQIVPATEEEYLQYTQKK